MSPDSLIQRAYREYSANGIGSLISEGVRFATVELWLEMLVQRQYMSRSELKDSAEREGNIWYENGEKPFKIKPVSHPVLREEFEPYQKEYSPQKPFVCEIQDCYLLGQYGLGLTENGKIISETTPYSSKKPRQGILEQFNSSEYLLLLGLQKQTTARRMGNRIFPLVDDGRGYYHWMVEYLPKIRLLEHYIEKTGHEPTILVRSNPSKFVEESLSFLGYGPDKYKEWEGGKAQVGDLVIPSHRTHRFDHQKPKQSNYNLSRSDLVWLRDRARSQVNNRNGSSKNIYISRQKADDRKVKNHNEVEEVIENFGFESYILEDLQFREQVELFTEADVIMGPHGAGLTNMVFADEPTIIEMFPEDTIKPHFYFISGVLGFEYEPIVTEAEDRNLIVDVDTLRVHLESVFD